MIVGGTEITDDTVASGMITGPCIGSPITTRNPSMRRRRFTMPHNNRRASVSFFRSIFIVARENPRRRSPTLKTANQEKSSSVFVVSSAHRLPSYNDSQSYRAGGEITIVDLRSKLHRSPLEIRAMPPVVFLRSRPYRENEAMCRYNPRWSI